MMTRRRRRVRSLPHPHLRPFLLDALHRHQLPLTLRYGSRDGRRVLVSELVGVEDELGDGGEEGVSWFVSEDEEEGFREGEDLVFGEVAVFVVIL